MIHSRNIQPQFHNSNDGTCIPSQQEEVSICMFKDLIGFYICVEDTESKMCAQHLLLCLSEHFRHQKRARLIFGGNGSKKTFRKKMTTCQRGARCGPWASGGSALVNMLWEWMHVTDRNQQARDLFGHHWSNTPGSKSSQCQFVNVKLEQHEVAYAINN